jgi:membrane-bound lytic murein transglycosylase A
LRVGAILVFLRLLKKERWAVGGAMACLIAAVAGTIALAIWLVPPPSPQGFRITQVDFAELNGWEADHQGQTLNALYRSCAVMARLPVMRAIGPDAIAGYAKDWREPCEASKSIDIQDHAAARDFFEVWFEPFLVTYDGDDVGLFTGYYEPTLEGSLTPNSQYTTALLARPKNLVTVKLGEFNREWSGEIITGQVIAGRLRPYPTRAEIVAGALRDPGLALVWVDDPIDAFFMHIQGSGRQLGHPDR